MKLIKNTLFASILSSIGLQLYLSMHYYQLHSIEGAGDSICNVNEKFNCSAVSLSAFSNILGLPISNIALALHLVLLVLIILGAVVYKNSADKLKSAINLSIISVIASVIMAGISALYLNTYCLFCIALYILSILICFLTSKLNAGYKVNIKDFFNLKLMLKPVLAIFGLSFLIHILLSSPISGKMLNKKIAFAIEDWRANPKITLVHKPMFSIGASKKNAKITIVEFADYLCPHCKNADPQIKAFIFAHNKNARLEFYPFPLDSQCNEALKFSRGGLSCKLTAAVFCAGKQNKALVLHEFIFKNQSKFHKSYNEDIFYQNIKNLKSGLNFNQWQSCFKNDKTQKAIRVFARAGQVAKVQGTPSFLVNQRKLDGAQFLPTLNKLAHNIVVGLD